MIGLFVSCKKKAGLDCFKGNGNEASETRYPGLFTSIKTYDKIDVDIVQGNAYKVEVFAYSHIIKNIFTKVEDGVLYIKNNNGCNFVRGYKKQIRVSVTVPQLEKLENWGVGITRFKNNYAGGRLKIIAESSGDIHFNGTLKKLITYSNGNGDIYLDGGNSDSLDVFMNGTNFLYGENFNINKFGSAITLSMGDCIINSTAGQLDYAIYKSGNIYVSGQPAVINNLNAEPSPGKLIRTN